MQCIEGCLLYIPKYEIEAASGRFCRGKIIRQNSEIYLQEDKNMSLTVRLLLIATLLLSLSLIHI